MSGNFPADRSDLVPTEVYSCCKCGALLFRKDQIVTHTPGEQELLFEKKKHDRHPAHTCMSYFLSSCPPWVKQKDLIECKIYCPNCSFRLGMLQWQGIQCSYILPIRNQRFINHKWHLGESGYSIFEIQG